MVFEGKVAPALRQLAHEQSLTILETEGAGEALKYVCSGRPSVIIVQVGRALNEVLKFIRLATTATWRVPVVAMATHHSLEIEREVLRAGATCYVPGVTVGFLSALPEAM